MLMARLLKDRSIARFVVAPTGYGKTSLLVDYAETMFSWVHVFWVNGVSPCFIRDLDEGTIAADCRAVDKDARLVVFDDVPLLDAERAQKFSDQIDELLDASCEVVVICTPQCDVYGRLQRDRIRVTARDLLLSDDEIDVVRAADERVQHPSDTVGAASRVPALVWKEGRDAESSFIRMCLKEQMPADLLLCMGTMFAMRSGTLDVLETVGAPDAESLPDLLADYPHFELDLDMGSFEAPDISPEQMASGLKSALDDMLVTAPYSAKEQLVWRWADLLVESEQTLGRACDIVRVMCPRGKRASWLALHVRELVERGCFFEGLELASSIRLNAKANTVGERSRCQAYEAVCRIVLGDEEGAVRCAKRLAFESSVDEEMRVCCLFIVARHGNEMLRSRACALIDEIARQGEGLSVGQMPLWVQLALSWHFASTDVELVGKWWHQLWQESSSGQVLCLTAGWFYTAIASHYEHHENPPLSFQLGDYAEIERYVRALLYDEGAPTSDYFVISTGLALERAHVQGMPFADGPLSARVLLVLRHAEMRLLSQKSKFDRAGGRDDSREDSWPRSRASEIPMAAAETISVKAKRNIPILHIKMFGRFEVSVGDDVIEDAAFHRKHVRLLMLLLSMNAGHDMSRASLARALWPDMPEDTARRSFYAAWSKLRRALMLSDGTCPYLVKHQFGCALDTRYVYSDVARLSEICRELLFGKPDPKGWSTLYAEIDKDFSNDLLPSEDNDELVMRARSDYKTKLVDALVSATQSVIDEGNYQLAVWFARLAIGRDETREDAYVALMRAQIESGQRTSAMMTYHKCRRVLAEKLGVDPSPETTALYEMLLDSQ